MSDAFLSDGEFHLVAKSIFMVDAMYYHAAKQNYERAVQLVPKVEEAERAMQLLQQRYAELEEQRQEIEEDLVEYDDRLGPIQSAQESLAIQMESAETCVGEAYAPYLQALAITHILSAAALESHINILAEEMLTGKELDRFLDKRNPIRNKWRSLPQMLGKEGFDEDRQPYLGFDRLINIRNSLVHYKAHEELWGSETGVPGFVDELALTREAAADSLKTVKAMTMALAERLGLEVPDWLAREPISYFGFSIE